MVADAETQRETATKNPTKIGLPTPNPPWTVVVVEDEDDFRDDIVEQLKKSDVAHGQAPLVIPVDDFAKAESVLSAQTIDVLILDVRNEGVDDHAGERVLEKLQQTRFVPVVFYTAYTERVDDLRKTPAIQVVGKDEHTGVLIDAVRAAFDSELPAAVRSLTDHVREVTREYLWDHISDQWRKLDQYGVEEKSTMLAARLARSLDLTLAVDRNERLRGPIGHAMTAKSLWHPSRIYIIPPLGEASDFNTGDVLLHEPSSRYWIQLTPSCDLANNKASRHLLIAATPLYETEPFAPWRDAESKWSLIKNKKAPKGGWSPEEKNRRRLLESKEKDLRKRCKDILHGRIERFFHLPQFLNIPDLLLDMQHVETPEESKMPEYNREAGLAPPWPQVLANRYSRQIGRVGYDDPDVDGILERMSENLRNVDSS